MAMDAMKQAASEAYKLVVEKTKSCLQNYYKRKPKIYRRTDSLKKAISGRAPRLRTEGDNCVVSFGVIYDSSRLNGVYKSNSRFHQSGDEWVSRFDNASSFNFDDQSNGVPDPGWILENYLNGVHPGWVNGKDYGWVDSENTRDTMTKLFKQELPNEAGKLIYKSMQGAILNFLKSNGGGR